MPDSWQMPWKATNAMTERARFILDWEARQNALQGRRVDVAELCRVYGVSRQTGYLWINRYQDAGRNIEAMEDRPRRPHSNPRAVDLAIEDAIVEARKAHPRWGPVPIRQWLVTRHPQQSFPSVSCIASILRRRGMTHARRRKRQKRPVVVTPPFPECTAPNQTWCMDFKGWFRLGTGEKCYPFTLLDAFSRMLLRCEATLEPDGYHVQKALDSAFREYGLPLAIRSDGGTPFFAAQSPATLSVLSVWLLRLGITLECIAPASPQQNGRLERFHLTLKQHVDPAVDVRAQQRAFDVFRGEYNHERPHAALQLYTPGSIYRRSPRKYPRALLNPYDGDLPGHVELVDRRGYIRWNKRLLFIGEAFSNQRVALWPDEHTRWEICFGSICLGSFDAERLDRGFLPTRRPRHAPMRLRLESDDF
jgi:transposase InsO family protein